ncbi:MAG: hypothetical protein ABI267_08375 [Ginsengibacter sp.]
MKKVFFVGLLFLAITSFAATPTLGEIRTLYEKSVTDEFACTKLIEILSPYNQSNNPLYAGYRASAIMMMAKHVFNPFSKMSYFRKGKSILESAIKADDKNVELRFLRFNAQTHMPSFLGYNNDIDRDKIFLETSFQKITDENLKAFLLPYLQNSDYIAADIKKQL